MLVTVWNSQIENDDFEEFFAKPREKPRNHEFLCPTMRLPTDFISTTTRGPEFDL